MGVELTGSGIYIYRCVAGCLAVAQSWPVRYIAKSTGQEELRRLSCTH